MGTEHNDLNDKRVEDKQDRLMETGLRTLAYAILIILTAGSVFQHLQASDQDRAAVANSGAQGTEKTVEHASTSAQQPARYKLPELGRIFDDHNVNLTVHLKDGTFFPNTCILKPQGDALPRQGGEIHRNPATCIECYSNFGRIRIENELVSHVTIHSIKPTGGEFTCMTKNLEIVSGKKIRKTDKELHLEVSGTLQKLPLESILVTSESPFRKLMPKGKDAYVYASNMPRPHDGVYKLRKEKRDVGGSYAGKDLSGNEGWIHFGSIYIHEGHNLESLRGIESIPNVYIFQASNHKTPIPLGLEKPSPNIRFIRLSGQSLKNLDGLEKFTGLEEMCIYRSYRPTQSTRKQKEEDGTIYDISNLPEMPSVKKIDIVGDTIPDLKNITCFPNLYEISLEDLDYTQNVAALSKLNALHKFSICRWSPGSPLEEIGELKQIKHFKSWYCDGNFEFLQHLKQLEQVVIYRGFKAPLEIDMKWFSQMLNLQILKVSADRVKTLSAIGKLTRLEELNIEGTPEGDLPSLSGFKQLTRVELPADAVEPQDFSGIESLEFLKLWGHAGHLLSQLKDLKKVETIDLSRTKDSKLMLPKSLTHVKTIHLSRYCRDVTALLKLKELKDIRFYIEKGRANGMDKVLNKFNIKFSYRPVRKLPKR